MKIKNATVLIVDDNDGTRRLLRMLLRDLGVREVIACACVEDGLKALHGSTIDLIFTDWEMIGETGMELVDSVRRADHERISRIPIIMMTAYGEEWRVKAARDAGITDFMLKPFSPVQIEAKLRTALLNVREFVDTDSYRGPDRRRGQRAYDGPDRRAANGDDATATQRQLADACGTLDRLRDDFERFLGEAATMIAAELRTASSHPSEARACCERIFQLAHNLKGQGSTFGYPLVTEIADELCRFLRARTAPSERDLALVAGYASALDTVSRNRVTGDGGQIGQRIIDRLRGFAAA